MGKQTQKEIQIAESEAGLTLITFLYQGISRWFRNVTPITEGCVSVSLGNLNLFLKMKKWTENFIIKLHLPPEGKFCLPVGRQMLPLGTWIKKCPGHTPTLTPTNVCARLGCAYSCPNTGTSLQIKRGQYGSLTKGVPCYYHRLLGMICPKVRRAHIIFCHRNVSLKRE